MSFMSMCDRMSSPQFTCSLVLLAREDEFGQERMHAHKKICLRKTCIVVVGFTVNKTNGNKFNLISVMPFLA